MESAEHQKGIRLRNQALRPIETKLKNRLPRTYDGDDEPLSPAGRLLLQPNLNVHILVIVGFKTSINLANVKDTLPRTLLKHPRFSSLLVVDEETGGNMKWVRAEVDLDKHIIIPEVDLGGLRGTHSHDKFVEDYMYNLTKTTLNKSQPLWDLHILNISTSNAEGVAIFRIHHALGDGISLMSLLLACARQTTNPEALPSLPAKKNKGYKKSGLVGRFLQGFFWLWWVSKLFWNTFADVLMVVATALSLITDSKTPIKGPPGSDYNPWRIVCEMLSLEDMKLVKNAMNVTINDVALGVTQAGLSKYLNRRYGLENRNDEGRTEMKNNLPKKIRLRSLLFFNIRPSAGIQVLADMMEKDRKAKWGNWFGYALLPFTIGLRDDPLSYIREAKAIADRKKHSLEAICTFSLVGLIFKFFGVQAANALFRRLLTGTTMTFSNVPGPLEEILLCGHPISFLAASCYDKACLQGLMINFQSHANKMSMTLSADENTIPDPHQLCDDIVESLELVKDAIIKKGLGK